MKNTCKLSTINLLRYQHLLTPRQIDGRKYLFDPVRKKNILLTPEELVRQLTIQYLNIEKGLPIARFSVEKQIKLNGTIKRYDIVIYGKDGKPFLLVECKRPEIMLDQNVCDQIARYNMVLEVPYLMITNGPKTFLFALNYADTTFEMITDFPAN